jgi:hypothetical protein
MNPPPPDPVTLEVLPSFAEGPPAALDATSETSPAVLPVDLSFSINAAFVAARAAAGAARDHAAEAVAAAVECGDLLVRQKASLPHGAWLPWLAEHCPGISAETARRYMRLAKRSRVTDLTEASSLRQAYLATGVLPDCRLREPAEPDATAPVITFTRGLDQFRRWYHRRTDELPLAKWTPEARRLLRNELAWFKKLHDELAG